MGVATTYSTPFAFVSDIADGSQTHLSIASAAEGSASQERKGESMKLESLHGLFIEELQDIYSAENMILKALPKMAEEASSSELRNAFNEHLEETRVHVRRLDHIFDQLGDIDRED